MKMARYAKNPFDEGKYQCVQCDYGEGEYNGKSRQSVSNHFKKSHMGEQVSTANTSPPIVEALSGGDIHTPPDAPAIEEDEVPEWASISFDDEEDLAPTESIPRVAKGMLNAMAGEHGTVRTGEALKEWYSHQARLLKWCFAGVVDPLVSWYGKSLMLDPSYSIQRTEEEWAMVEGISAEWLEYRGINLPINPDLTMVACVGALYGPTLLNIHKKRHPSTKKTGLFARFRQWRAKKRILKTNPLNEVEPYD